MVYPNKRPTDPELGQYWHWSTSIEVVHYVGYLKYYRSNEDVILYIALYTFIVCGLQSVTLEYDFIKRWNNNNSHDQLR